MNLSVLVDGIYCIEKRSNLQAPIVKNSPLNGEKCPINHSKYNILRLNQESLIGQNGSSTGKNHSSIQRNCSNTKKNHSNIRRNGSNTEKNHSSIRRNGSNTEKNHSNIRRNGSNTEKNHSNIQRNRSNTEKNHSNIQRNGSKVPIIRHFKSCHFLSFSRSAQRTHRGKAATKELHKPKRAVF